MICVVAIVYFTNQNNKSKQNSSSNPIQTHIPNFQLTNQSASTHTSQYYETPHIVDLISLFHVRPASIFHPYTTPSPHVPTSHSHGTKLPNNAIFATYHTCIYGRMQSIGLISFIRVQKGINETKYPFGSVSTLYHLWSRSGSQIQISCIPIWEKEFPR